MSVVYGLQERIDLCEERIHDAKDTHERHFYEDRLVYLENLNRRYSDTFSRRDHKILEIQEKNQCAAKDEIRSNL